MICPMYHQKAHELKFFMMFCSNLESANLFNGQRKTVISDYRFWRLQRKSPGVGNWPPWLRQRRLALNIILFSCSILIGLASFFLVFPGWMFKVATLRRVHHVADFETWLHRHSACTYFLDLPLILLKSHNCDLFNGTNGKSENIFGDQKCPLNPLY